MTDKTRSENWGQSIEGIECHIYIYNKGNSDNGDSELSWIQTKNNCTETKFKLTEAKRN